MLLENIKAVKLSADDKTILFLWAAPPKFEGGLEVMNAWGFSYRTHMVWGKDKIGIGYYARQKHEDLLIGIKGNGIGMPLPENRPESVVFNKGEYSSKPDVFYEIIEGMYPNHTKVELFARNTRTGWEVWVNDV
jgi:N6-adenosine-specific RNA methylase IME4